MRSSSYSECPGLEPEKEPCPPTEASGAWTCPTLGWAHTELHLQGWGRCRCAGGGWLLRGAYGCCLARPVRLFCNPMDCSPPDSSVHGISQARMLKWVAISLSRESSRPRDQSHDSCIGRRILYHLAIRGSLSSDGARQQITSSNAIREERFTLLKARLGRETGGGMLEPSVGEHVWDQKVGQ